MIRIVIIIPIRGGRWEMFSRAFEIEVELTFPFGVCHGDIDRCEKKRRKIFCCDRKKYEYEIIFPISFISWIVYQWLESTIYTFVVRSYRNQKI